MGIASIRRHYDGALKRGEALTAPADPDWRAIAVEKDREANALRERITQLEAGNAGGDGSTKTEGGEEIPPPPPVEVPPPVEPPPAPPVEEQDEPLAPSPPPQAEKKKGK